VSPICLISSATLLLSRLRCRAQQEILKARARARVCVCVCVCVYVCARVSLCHSQASLVMYILNRAVFVECTVHYQVTVPTVAFSPCVVLGMALGLEAQ
jgi:hypothetical protein